MMIEVCEEYVYSECEKVDSDNIDHMRRGWSFYLVKGQTLMMMITPVIWLSGDWSRILVSECVSVTILTACID